MSKITTITNGNNRRTISSFLSSKPLNTTTTFSIHNVYSGLCTTGSGLFWFINCIKTVGPIILTLKKQRSFKKTISRSI